MIPLLVLFNYVDAQVAFKIERISDWMTRAFSVSRARDGVLRLSDGQTAVIGDATAILGRLNCLLWQEDDSLLTLEPQYDPFFDEGSSVEYQIVAEAAKGRKSGLAEHVRVESNLLANLDRMSAYDMMVVETTVGKVSTLYAVTSRDGMVTDMLQLSRHALPKDIHKALAGTGISWSAHGNSLTPEESYVRMYGEEALEEARRDREDEYNAFVRAPFSVKQASSKK